jgi:general secretion pathway protein H
MGPLGSGKDSWSGVVNRDARGWTLLEMVVVLIIIGIAFALALPPVGRGLSHWRLQGAVREVATLFKFTRNQSVARRTSLQVVLDRSRNVYWLDRADAPVDSDLAQVMKEGIRLYALPAGIRFGEVILGDEGVSEERVGMQFFPRGNSTGGEVEIRDERGRDYRIRVDPVTGSARIKR